MNNYLVTINWMHPYPKSVEYRVTASSIPVAAARGLRLWRKDNKGLRVYNLSINISKL